MCEITPRTNVSVFVPVSVGPRSYRLLIRGANELPDTVRDFAAVNFVTGCCLFSPRALSVRGEGGVVLDCLTPRAQPIATCVREITSSASLTLYELESALRLGSLVADFAGLLPPVTTVTATIDVPRVQYYLYLLDAFHSGFVGPDLMLRWFELVDERCRLVTRRLVWHLVRALSDRHRGRGILVRRAQSMACLASPIRRSIKTRTPIEVGRMAEMVGNEDPAWAVALDVARPTTYRDLINLSYVVEQLRSGIRRPGSGPQLGAVVDNHGEWMTYERTRALTRRIGPPGSGESLSLLALYPLERVFTGQTTGPSDLYYNDPGHDFIDRQGCRYTTSGLLAALYPDFANETSTAARAA